MNEVSSGEMGAADIVALFDRGRLRIARELRGYTQVQLAREAGSITAGSLSQFENGHSRPAAVTLGRLAVVLQVPLAFFAAPARLGQEEPVTGFFRSLRSTAPRDRQRALAYVQLARELTLELEKYVALPGHDLSWTGQEVADGLAREEIEDLAHGVRQRWNVPPGPVEDVVRAMERHGIVTTRFHVGLNDVDAFSVPFPDRPIVALGADKGLRDRSRFDASHELGHLIMHRPDQVGSKVIETQAHQFAAAFLMPEADIRSELPSRADWPKLLKLKAKWQVSIAALLMRAKTLDVMDERTYTQAWKTLSARGWRKSEPGDLGPPERPTLLQRAVDVAEDAGMSFEALIKQAGLPESDIRALLGDAKDPRPRVQL